MASISTDPKGNKAIQFIAADKRRRTVRIGKLSTSMAEKIKRHVEDLNNANIMREAPHRRTAEWVADLEDTVHGKLVAAGLVKPRPAKGQSALGNFLTTYVESRVDIKPATKEVWGQVVRNLKEYYGEHCDIATIDEAKAEEFKMWLKGQKLAATTVHKRLQFARMFFRAARKRRLITANPFDDVKAAAVEDESRRHYVSHKDTEALLKAANPTWRTIIGLARYAGLRCPSEVLSLPWRNVDWANSRIVVVSPKTEHHPGKGRRTIPLFGRLRPILEEAWELAPEGAEFVVGGNYRQAANTASGWRSCNLRTQFDRIITRAGLTPWPRLFHNLRASCATDLVFESGGKLHLSSKWLGHDPKVALADYLMANDEDFQRAAECGANMDGDRRNRAEVPNVPR